MAKRRSTREKSAPGADNLAAVRRDVNRRVRDMALATLAPETRSLFLATRGNPHIQMKLERFVSALLSADDLLQSSQLRRVEANRL